jgi:hypothetical protein
MKSTQEKIKEAAEAEYPLGKDNYKVETSRYAMQAARINAYTEGANFALSLDRWISVDEALPEPGREVLTYGAKENWNGAVMYRYVGINRTEWYMRAPYDSEPLQCYTPTHWCEITPPNTKER